MNYKIIFSDIDGTLLTTKNDVSEFTVSEIKKRKDSIPFILVSARMPKSMTYLQERLSIENTPIICYNGALVIIDGKTVSSSVIHINILKQLFSMVSEHDIRLGLYFEDEWIVEEDSERVRKEIFNTKAIPTYSSIATTINNWEKSNKGAHKIMCMGTEENIDLAYQLLIDEFKTDLHIYRSNATLIEIANKNVSKLSGIHTILKKCYPYSIQEAIAFGDNYNDMEMIEAVGHGVAMGNARQEVKEIANAIADDHKNDGVAKYVKHLF